jgi:hypothetical protein
VSREKEVEKLAEMLRGFERMLVKGALPEMPVIRQRVDGTDDAERFLADYGCTVEQAGTRGATAFIVRTNFRSPTVEVQHGPFTRTRSDYFPPEPPKAPKPVALSEDDEPAPADDPLTELLLRQACDMARMRDAARAKDAGK